MQTQLDQSLIDLLIFHTLDVTVFTTISTVTLISNNVPDAIAYALVFVYKVFLLMDGFCLIFYAIIKYLSIFYQSILHTYMIWWLKKNTTFWLATIRLFISIVDLYVIVIQLLRQKSGDYKNHWFKLQLHSWPFFQWHILKLVISLDERFCFESYL